MLNVFNKRILIFALAPVSVLGLCTASQAYEINVDNTKINLYGFAQLDVAYNSGPEMAASGFVPLQIRPDDVDGSEGHTDLGAYTSRLGISTVTPTKHGPFKTVIEGDFNGNGGGSFRLRHAYGVWNGILAGQTWTNFSGVVGLTPTIDFTGPVGRPNAGRLAQLRYTTGNFSVALEDPDTFSADIAGSDPSELDEYNNYYEIENQSRLPALTMRYKNSQGPLSYEFGALIRELGYYNSIEDNDEYGWGWGLNAAASYTFSRDIVLRGVITHGDGIGGYTFFNPGGAGYVDESGDIETIEASAADFGVTVPAGPGAFNISYAIVKADLDGVVDDGRVLPTPYGYEQYNSVFVNYIWSPIERVAYGIEAAHHKTEQVTGGSGDTYRVQGMIRYKF
ncbi:DcaP family trimeric outer membrane transporter [Halomonas sp. McH1-25]|uniref:DcaP family trimeric outer membrane transporter n=1 Tax=unclassified Halomonas TaxID=2609666 RepID=UPI001EF6FA75|nr:MULTISPECIES: DcaP family trimeric outer membrane transporter [unclassified Halomonas]MCG7602238.1 DcaP family trimeric outer membrane transporter [Halomonas sp. McH1-25]MCP1344593.1 DcaP family trimeric outer membrane transporter [Halomonas sp. FL8]MCP1362867.1 DcaP family trimeric outer membrane transporter [Halomonas sp. BBD45]MCP1363743.1 DcaP family trimeric outer membrane transporter [Halomonas sp. BBD48]